MSEPTPEQIVAEAMVNAGAPLVHSRVEDAVVAALRDAGKLVAASAVIPPEPEAGQLSQRIEALEGKHAPILVWTGGSAPEPSHEVCSACGEGECAFEADLRALLAEFQFVLAAPVQVDEAKLPTVTRVTLVSRPGAKFGFLEDWDYEGVELLVQDDGRTLKVLPLRAGPWLPVPTERDGGKA